MNLYEVNKQTIMYSIPDPWTRPNVFPQMQMGTIQDIPQPVAQASAQRLLPPAAQTSVMFPSDGALRMGHDDVAVPHKGLFGTSFTLASNGQHVHPNSVITNRMNKIGMAAAIGVPLVAGAAALHNYIQSQPSEEDKANALLNHHLRG